MNGRILSSLVTKSIVNKDMPDGKNKHFSFLFRSSKPIALGYNKYWKTHPEAKRLNYRFSAIHSELACILSARSKMEDLSGCILINIRINRFGDIRNSRPCKSCMELIRETGIRTVWHTTNDGEFERIRI